MSTGLLLAGLIALGSLLWSWAFPAAEPVVVQASAADQPGQPAGSPAAATAPSGKATAQTDLIPIYLVGAVSQPGIYEVERGSYLYQLVQRAGGLTENAAAEQINLALRLDCNQLIRLPTCAEAAASPGLAIVPASSDSSAGQPIDLNAAGQDELDSLPGIGPSTALAIIEYRRKNGSFRSVEDLMKVPGIKESRFSAIKDMVVVRTSS